jgi:predicted nucleotidyltransferase component of viral defense system
LVAQGMIHRPTRDVDLFLLDTGASEITVAAASLEAALDRRGWSNHRVIDQRNFIRLEVHGDAESLIVDLGIDSPAEEPLDTTELGPTLSPRDLAARKTLALFGRAEARDFADVYDLARRYGREQLLGWAATDDAGFDHQIFAGMLTTIDRFDDEDLPVQRRHAASLRAYFHDWAAELAGA